MIENLLKKYSESGEFTFNGGANLRKVMVDSGVPEALGVYLIFESRGDTEELIYIGKAGSVKRNGSRSRQGLFSRLQNKQDGVARQKYFSDYIAKNEVILHIFWFATQTKELSGDFPAFVEADLLQEYFKENGRLSKLNKSI